MKKFYGKVDDKGKFNPNLVDDVKKHIGTLIGKDIEIRIGVRGKGRSNEQNSLYWLWLTELELWSGQAKEDWHNFFQHKFLLKRDKKIPYVLSTTELDTVGFTDYLANIENWMSEFDPNFRFPHPEELYR